MDINKEREDFEAEFSKIKSDIAFWLHTWDEEMQGYNHPVMCWFWYIWQAAKARSVPEGFVLVPKEIPKSFDEGLYFYSNSISVVNEHSDGFIPMSDIDHSEIWKLVIEAQEQAND